MQQTREQTIGYILDMVSELQTMADKSGNPMLALLLKMAKIEAENSLKDDESADHSIQQHKQPSLA